MEYDRRLAIQLQQTARMYYKNGEWFEANHFFTKAIELSPKTPSNYSFRAACNMKLNNWYQVELDCRKAIEVDPHDAWAYNILGRALLHFGAKEEAIQNLKKVLDLSIRFSVAPKILHDARRDLYKARYQVWERDSPRRLYELYVLKNACKTALREKNNDMNQLKCLDEVFDKAMQAYTPGEVPPFLCCPITLNVLRDPVISTSGITYERGSLLRYFSGGSHIDPTTRQPIDPEHLVPNLALREAVEEFLHQNGWALKIDKGN